MKRTSDYFNLEDSNKKNVQKEIKKQAQNENANPCG